MLVLGVALAVADMALWRFIVAGSGTLAGDAICTDSWGENGAKCARPFWNGTVSLARSLSSIWLSAVRTARCTSTRSTRWLTHTLSTTTRRRAQPITHAGIIFAVVGSVSITVVQWVLAALVCVAVLLALLLSGRGL